MDLSEPPEHPAMAVLRELVEAEDAYDAAREVAEDLIRATDDDWDAVELALERRITAYEAAREFLSRPRRELIEEAEAEALRYVDEHTCAGEGYAIAAFRAGRLGW